VDSKKNGEYLEFFT